MRCPVIANRSDAECLFQPLYDELLALDIIDLALIRYYQEISAKYKKAGTSKAPNAEEVFFGWKAEAAEYVRAFPKNPPNITIVDVAERFRDRKYKEILRLDLRREAVQKRGARAPSEKPAAGFYNLQTINRLSREHRIRIDEALRLFEAICGWNPEARVRLGPLENRVRDAFGKFTAKSAGLKSDTRRGHPGMVQAELTNMMTGEKGYMGALQELEGELGDEAEEVAVAIRSRLTEIEKRREELEKMRREFELELLIRFERNLLRIEGQLKAELLNPRHADYLSRDTFMRLSGQAAQIYEDVHQRIENSREALGDIAKIIREIRERLDVVSESSILEQGELKSVSDRFEALTRDYGNMALSANLKKDGKDVAADLKELSSRLLKLAKIARARILFVT